MTAFRFKCIIANGVAYSRSAIRASVVAPKSKRVHDQPLCCYPNVKSGIWVWTPPFPPFSSYSIISEKIFGLEFKCISRFAIRAFVVAPNGAWSWMIMHKKLYIYQSTQMSYNPATHSLVTCVPKGISRGTSSIWKVKFSVKGNGGFYTAVSRLSLQFFITLILNPPWTKP